MGRFGQVAQDRIRENADGEAARLPNDGVGGHGKDPHPVTTFKPGQWIRFDNGIAEPQTGLITARMEGNLLIVLVSRGGKDGVTAVHPLDVITVYAP